ncbi:uncharacterized protein LOC122244608 isoform X2 [Penaeus japonicus]|uniref:uncharacterized protein LOC122244608 isoform X2 n=1 Tax=Penaeus japonicus TaxID=27405 RepID=UPI001C70B464|nr:uncharacterized protein LOC122244608 isoform X2 [Penaeus japonicus]
MEINDVEVYAERIPSRFKPIAQVTDTQQGIMDTRYTASQPQSTCSRDQKLNLQCVLQGKEKGGVASLPDEQLLSTDKSGHVPNERQQEKIGNGPSKEPGYRSDQMQGILHTDHYRGPICVDRNEQGIMNVNPGAVGLNAANHQQNALESARSINQGTSNQQQSASNQGRVYRILYSGPACVDGIEDDIMILSSKPLDTSPADQQSVSESASSFNTDDFLNLAPRSQLQNVPLDDTIYEFDQQQSTSNQTFLYNPGCDGGIGEGVQVIRHGIGILEDENSQQTCDAEFYVERIPSSFKPSAQAIDQSLNINTVLKDSQPKLTSGQIQNHTASASTSTCNLDESFLWVQLAVPGEGLKQFLRKNWIEMLKRLPVPRPMNCGRLYEWQK